MRMDGGLRQRLDALPSLDRRAGLAAFVACKVCRHAAHVFDVVDFQKHCGFGEQYAFGLSGIAVRYYRCASCGFLFTDFCDDWSTSDFARYIYNGDYALVDPDYAGARAAKLAGMISGVLRGCEALRILDYGSGAGIFVDAMREAGFTRTEGFDPFSNPERPEGTFDLVTCFEVLEHMAWPNEAMADIGSLLRPGGCLVFTQSVQPREIARIRGAWWYMAPRNGHISTFTAETLQRLLASPAHTLHGNGLLWAMVPPSPHPLLADRLLALGPALLSATLRPPSEGAFDSWHPAEHVAEGRFRWSCADTLQWRLGPPARVPAKLELHLPFTLEIEPGFASRCVAEIGGASAKISLLDSEIVIEASIESALPELVLTVQTPTPRSPFELGGVADSRPLGLGMMLD